LRGNTHLEPQAIKIRECENFEGGGGASGKEGQEYTMRLKSAVKKKKPRELTGDSSSEGYRFLGQKRGGNRVNVLKESNTIG